VETTSESDLAAFQNTLGYQFVDTALLVRSLTHSSCKSDLNYCNERLEFLGDAILGIVVSEHLFREFPQHSEGQLTRVKSVVVSRATLGRVAKALDFGSYLIVGKGVASRGSLPPSLQANAFDAVLAAIYIDGGMEPARRFTLRCLSDTIDRVIKNRHEPNYKSILQQYAQKVLSSTPSYRVMEESGPDHLKAFTVVAIVDGVDSGVGAGNTKKQAEQMAAAETLKMLGVPVYGGSEPKESPNDNDEDDA